MKKRSLIVFTVILVLLAGGFLLLRGRNVENSVPLLTPSPKVSTGTPADHIPHLSQFERDYIALEEGEELVYRTFNREVGIAELPAGSYTVRIALEAGFIRNGADGELLRLYELGNPVLYLSGGDVNSVHFSSCAADCTMDERSARISFTTDISCALREGTFTYPEKTYTLELTEEDFAPLPIAPEA